MNQTINELTIVRQNTFKNTQKERSSSDITFRYLIESRWCGRESNESRLSVNEIVMKSVSTVGICGDGTTTSTRTSTGRKILVEIFAIAGLGNFIVIFQQFHRSSRHRTAMHKRNLTIQWLKIRIQNFQSNNLLFYRYLRIIFQEMLIIRAMLFK